MMISEVKEMKKWFIILGVWFVVAMSLISGNARSAIEFEITYDSHTKTTFPLKEEIEMKYYELVEGIHELSYLSMIRSNLNYFAVQDNLQITFDHCLKIVEGDGKGEVIKGTLEAYQICLPQVQPKSIFSHLHNWFFS